MLELLSEIDSWIKTHQALVATIAVPLLTLAITTVSGRASDKRAQQSKRSDRELQKEMQIAEFRLRWIEELRVLLADYNALLSSFEFDAQDYQRLTFLMSKFQLMVNPADPDVGKLISAMSEALGQLNEDEPEITGEMHMNICTLGQQFLKKEWERLKIDVEQVDGTLCDEVVV
ncbi:hypothetical protein [Shimia sediminis]|uniref:hypothetical protein n=1 Tax=Shimia sediminis TaxID=2497945 RepID=UPI000F8D796F|nr:hypothetical protein [Shimia sediminis]